MPEPIRVIGYTGCGSAIAEAFLALADLPFIREEVNYGKPSPERDRLFALNPLGQIPTLILSDSTILTETLAVAAYAQSLSKNSPLIPTNERTIAQFWRWATFIIAAVYPTFTYGDEPEKWVRDESGAKQLRISTDEWRKKLLKVLESEAKSPYFLGETFSAIDIYIAVMGYWRPGRAWVRDECPHLYAIGEIVKSKPILQPIWQYHKFE